MTAAPDAGVGLGLVLDCADPDRLAGFWAAALGYEHVGTFGKYAMLMARDRSRGRFELQAVPGPKRHKNPMHIDLAVVDLCRRMPESFRRRGAIHLGYLRRYPELASLATTRPGIAPNLTGYRRRGADLRRQAAARAGASALPLA